MMNTQSIKDRLLGERAQLEALGLAHVSLFGSTARGEARPDSDVDLAVCLDPGASIDLFRFAAISEKLSRLLGTRVDLVVEPARSRRMQSAIERDRVHFY